MTAAVRSYPVETLEEQMHRVADGVSFRYARRCSWAEQDDLYQQAYSVVAEVLREYPPLDQRGRLRRDVFGAWAWRAAMKQLSRYLWKQSSPVTACDGYTGRRVPIVGGSFGREGAETPDAGCVDLPDAYSVEVDLSEREVLARLEARLYELCGDNPWNRCAVEVLLRGERPAEASRAAGLPRGPVYKATEYMRAAARADDVVRELAVELLEVRSRL